MTQERALYFISPAEAPELTQNAGLKTKILILGYMVRR